MSVSSADRKQTHKQAILTSAIAIAIALAEEVLVEILTQHAHLTLQALIKQQSRRDGGPVESSSSPAFAWVDRMDPVLRCLPLHLLLRSIDDWRS